MATPRNIPQVSYNTPFGDISKVIWFEVVDDENYFELYFSIELQQYKSTNLQLYNNTTNENVWTNSYPPDTDQENYLDSVRILYLPQPPALQPFGLLNLPD